MGAEVLNNTLSIKKDLVVAGNIKGSTNAIYASSLINFDSGIVHMNTAQLTLTNDGGTEIVGTGSTAMNISSEGDLHLCSGLNNDTGTNDVMYFGTRQGGGGTYYEMRLQDGKLSIGDNFSASNTLHLKNVTGSALEVMRLDQEDVDEPFIRFEGTTAADQTKSLTTVTSVGSHEGHVLVSINGADKWIPYYAKS